MVGLFAEKDTIANSPVRPIRFTTNQGFHSEDETEAVAREYGYF